MFVALCCCVPAIRFCLGTFGYRVPAVKACLGTFAYLALDPGLEPAAMTCGRFRLPRKVDSLAPASHVFHRALLWYLCLRSMIVDCASDFRLKGAMDPPWYKIQSAMSRSCVMQWDALCKVGYAAIS